VSEEASLVERARGLLDEGESVAAVLELLQEHGCSGSIPMIQALREVVPLGLREAVEIVDAFRRGDARIQEIDSARLLLLAHPGAAPRLNLTFAHSSLSPEASPAAMELSSRVSSAG